MNVFVSCSACIRSQSEIRESKREQENGLLVPSVDIIVIYRMFCDFWKFISPRRLYTLWRTLRRALRRMNDDWCYIEFSKAEKGGMLDRVGGGPNWYLCYIS